MTLASLAGMPPLFRPHAFLLGTEIGQGVKRRKHSAPNPGKVTQMGCWMPIDTNSVREQIKTNENGKLDGYQVGLLLLCDILDELRNNAANRQKALENWKGGR